MRTVFEFVYGIAPVTALRARGGANNQHYTPKRYRDFKTAMANAIKGRFIKDIQELSWDTEKGKRRYFLAVLVYGPSVLTGDWDNYAKGVQDAIADAGLIHNDRQVSCGFCGKIESPIEQVEFLLIDITDTPVFSNGMHIALRAFRVLKFFLTYWVMQLSKAKPIESEYTTWEDQHYGHAG